MTRNREWHRDYRRDLRTETLIVVATLVAIGAISATLIVLWLVGGEI